MGPEGGTVLHPSVGDLHQYQRPTHEEEERKKNKAVSFLFIIISKHSQKDVGFREAWRNHFISRAQP